MTTSVEHAPSTGSFFPLGAFGAAVQSDEEILGLLYTGSLGRGAADRYSDLDLDVWVTAEAHTHVDAKIDEILAALGMIQFVYRRGPAFVTAFVGPGWQRVDLHLHGPGDTKTFPDYAHGRIVKDVRGTLRGMVDDAPLQPVVPSWETVRAEIEEAIDSLLYATLHNARGEHWSAASEITERLGRLYMLLAGLRGCASHGLRYVTRVLTADEQQMLVRAWPARIERDEVRRAAGELWGLIRYVWEEGERVLEHSLEITIDESGMLQAIDAFYSSPSG